MFIIPQTEEDHLESNQKIYESLKKCLDLREKYLSNMTRHLNTNLHLENSLTLKTKDSKQILDDLKTLNINPAPISMGEITDESALKHGNNETISFVQTCKGIVLIHDNRELKFPTFMDYMDDIRFLLSICYDRPTKSFAYRRLEHLKHNFLMYKNLYSEKEKYEQKMFSRRDFYTVVKVDTHVHHSACMNSKHLQKFMKRKLRNSGDEVVYQRVIVDGAEDNRDVEAKMFGNNEEDENKGEYKKDGDSKKVKEIENDKNNEEDEKYGEKIEYENKIDDKKNTMGNISGDQKKETIKSFKYKIKNYTLKDIFKMLGITEENLRIDNLDTHAHTDTFHRFDRFNNKYNPLGQPVLREIFLKYDNFINGKYLAQITNETIQAIIANKYVYVEYRISIYGKKREEWYVLADWIVNNKLINSKVRWVIQIPRLYRVWKASASKNNKKMGYNSMGNSNNKSLKFSNDIGTNRDNDINNSTIDNSPNNVTADQTDEHSPINSFGDMLNNIFVPIFEATRDTESHQNLSLFLTHVIGFDCVDDESIREKPFQGSLVDPFDYTFPEEPPYGYYLFHLYRHIAMVNCYRMNSGKNTFAFTPHAGEAGDWEHLAHAFLVGSSICHGVLLRKCLPLQYLYYLSQVGIAMSPLSNNSLFVRLAKSPFPDFFGKGLRVTLSTDDPLQLHFTREPLMEEYSVASQVWKLSSCDQCEIARNSVLISNFPNKDRWIGEYWKEGVEGNDIGKTNVANLRIDFRYRMWKGEIDRIRRSR